ncbi:MAG: hypothetical protein RI909_381 [Bacteroidota bacterium]
MLSEYSLTLQSSDGEVVIPYANMVSVRLKRSGKKFVMVIKPTDQPEVQISNQYVLSTDQTEYRSPQYVTFVRVLHLHLREKSLAYYVCGNNLQHIVIALCVAVIISFGLSYSLDRFQLNPLHNNITALIFSMASISLIVVANWGRFPNVYKPEDIPLDFLPSI